MQHVSTAEDRSILVPPGKVVVTGYVKIDGLIFACRDRMSIGDLDVAYRRRLQCGTSQPWPCPRGHWKGETFVIDDGRHEAIAAMMLGVEYILCAWIDE